MARVDLDAEREERIPMDILVDIYEHDDVAMGWYHYLERTLGFPFPALWRTFSKKTDAKADLVEVVGMEPEEDCSSEMVCETAFEGDVFSVPLINLTAPDADEKTQEAMVYDQPSAIADWYYWVNRGKG